MRPLLCHIAFAAFLLLWWFGLDANGWWLLLGLHIYLAVMFYGSAFIGSNFYVPAQCRLPERKGFLLTFDDGIHPEYTPRVLDILQQYQQKAVFFCIGKNLESTENQVILKRMIAEGHTVGNHSYSHSPFFDFYNSQRVEEELRRTSALIESVTGQPVRLFRPPYGVTNPPIGRAVKRLGYSVMGWSLRSLDTVIHDEERLLQRVLSRFRPGDIILLHDHHERIVSFLPRLLEALNRRGE